MIKKKGYMLFPESELARMSLEELLNTESVKHYIACVKERRWDFKTRLRRVR